MWAEQATATPERRRGQRRALRGFQYALSVWVIYHLATHDYDLKMMRCMANALVIETQIHVLDSRFHAGHIDQATYENEVKRLSHALQHPSCR